MFKRHEISINETTLGYGYNPDIYYRHDDRHHEHPLNRLETLPLRLQGVSLDYALPTKDVLKKSDHAKNVQRWLEFLE